MPTVTFALDDEAFARLTSYAQHEERTPDGQAKILVLKALDAYKEYRPKSPVVKGARPPKKPSIFDHLPPTNMGSA